MRLSIVCISVILLGSSAFAQSDRGTITGTVSDPAGAVVPNAPIQARNVETGVVYEGATSTTGNYSIPQLPVGPYDVSVGMQGFKKYSRTGLQVGTEQTLRVDIALEVGSASESVTVTEAAPLLKTESGELSHTVNLNELTQLPLFVVTGGIRNPNQIMNLIPGTYSAGDIRVNGVPNNSQSYRIEGQDASNSGLPSITSQNQSGVDAILEIAVQTSNFSAEYGQVGGGVLNITMKSGTNQFHGSGFEYFVNEDLNAGEPYTDNGQGGNLRPRTRRNDFGYTVGGPVWIPKVYDGRNKSFFFVSWEEYRVSLNNANDPHTVPTPAMRVGDFSADILPNARVIGTDPVTGATMLQGMIYDPATTRTVNGVSVRTQFPGNMIPPSRFDPVAVKIQNLIPLPVGANATSLINNFINPYPSSTIQHIPSVKADQAIGAKGKLTFFWQHTQQSTLGGTGLQQGDGLPGYLTTSLASFVSAPLYRLNFDYTLRPTLLLHFGAGYHSTYFGTPALTSDNKVVYTSAPFNAAQQLGLTGGLLNRFFPSMQNIMDPTLGGMKNIAGSAAGVPNGSQIPTYNATATWVRSNHTYKFGSEFRTEGDTAPNPGNDGIYTFSAAQTGEPFQSTPVGGVNVGLPYASFLLGQVNQVSQSGPISPRQGKHQFGVYAQDSWKVTRRFTLDYGLRYDYSTYLRDTYGRIPVFLPTLIDPAAGIPGAAAYDGYGPKQCNCSLSHNYPYAVSPRLGAAYQITSKTVLRAGFGIVYNGTEQGNQADITVASSAGGGTAATFGSALTTLSAGYPAQFDPRPWPSYDPAFYPTSFPTPGGGPTQFDPNAGRPARQYQWSIGLQREIVKDLVVEASYVGNRGIWWQAPGLLNYDAISLQRLASFGINLNNAADRTLLTSFMSSTAAQQRGIPVPYPGFPLGQTVFQALRPFPQYTSIGVAYDPLGKTWYDSLQIKGTKRLSHGLAFTTTFTWQKNLNIGAEREPNFGTAASGQVNDVFNRPLNKYISGYSQPLVLLTSITYITPKVNANKVLSWIVRDWTYGAYLGYRSGLPYLVPSAQSTPGLANLLGQPTFADRVPGVPLYTVDLNCHCYNPLTTFVLNKNAWVDPPSGQFGTAAAYYSDYRTQRRPTENMNFGRTFRITERVNLNVRAEFSDIFNRAFIGDVGTGAASVGASPTINNLTNATATVQTRNANGTTASGFGALLNVSPMPGRQGNIVARITF